MKLLIIVTGGTIGSTVQNGYINIDQKSIETLINLSGISNTNVSFDISSPYAILSETLNGSHIAKLISFIDENVSNYDGIIITHGTDTLSYTAAACRYAFSDVKIPIIFVSSNYILSDERANGVANFQKALSHIIEGGTSGVYVSYKNTGGDAKMYNPLYILPHETFSDEIHSIETKPEDATAVMKSAAMNLTETSNILWLKCYPGMTYPSLENTCEYILLDSFHSGTINTSAATFLTFMDAASQRGIPVFLTGLDSSITYETTRVYDELKINILPKISPIASYIKLWILSVEDNLSKDEIIKLMREDA